MEKKTVMKALSVCGRGIESCPECPYFNEAACGRHMCDDALALIKADEKANEKPTYHKAFIFTKRDNLLKWFDVHAYKYAWGANMEYSDQYKKMEALYAKEREIQLILLVRYENEKCICRIKCPINPLPIKGEFQCVSVSEMSKLLASMGWKYKEKIYSGMFQAK